MKVMLVDDHPLFLEGLQYVLETHGICIVGVATNGREALGKARILKPDIILMDIRMPECSGLEALVLIKAEMENIRIIMLTTSEDDIDLFDAIKYGAAGYLLKSTNAKELVGILSYNENGGIPLSPGLAARFLEELKAVSSFQNITSQQEPEDIEYKADIEVGQLTGRQLEILQMVARGITYKEVGASLGLTERTVKYHMERIIELLHLENRAQVIAYATRIGL